jgi:hypothetical protein
MACKHHLLLLWFWLGWQNCCKLIASKTGLALLLLAVAAAVIPACKLLLQLCQ